MDTVDKGRERSEVTYREIVRELVLLREKNPQPIGLPLIHSKQIH